MATATRARTTTLAVGYARRSTERQEQSIPDQRAAVEAYALAHGYELLDWYVDDAVSGAGTAGRDAFLQMVEDARRPGCPFEAVLVYDVKRFGRLDNDETGHYRYLLRQAGVDIVYVAEGFNGDDTDDLLRPVKQWQARQELKDLSKVTIRGLLSKGQGGWWLGGVPPYGYDLSYCDERGDFLMVLRYVTQTEKEVLDADGKVQRRLGKGERLMVSKGDRARLVPSSQERVDTVRRIFGCYVRDGMGYKGIASRLNADGVPSPRGGKWSMTTVRDLLRNPVYVGDMVWNRRTMAKFHRIESGRATPAPKVRRRVMEQNDPDDWMVTEDAHPALIDRNAFQAAQAQRRQRCTRPGQGYRQGRGAKSDYLLTGLIVCGHCGHRWQGYSQWKGRRRKGGSRPKSQYYACGGYVTKGTSVCPRSVVRKDELEAQVFAAIGEHIRQYVATEDGRSKLCEALQDALAHEMADTGELERLRRERDEALRKVNNILDNLTPTNREFADRRIAELKKELRALDARLAELEATSAAQPDLDELTDEMLSYMGSFEQVVSEGTVDEKRRFVRAFVQRIEIEPETQERLLLLRTPTPLQGEADGLQPQ